MQDDSTPFSVGIDGYNLAMARGTGVATYGRTLCHAIKRLGHRLDLVYGLSVPPTARSELRESLFFARMGDDIGEGQPPLKKTLRRMLLRALIAPAPRDLVEVPVTGKVIAPELAERLPPFDRLYTLSGLFETSARYFRRYRSFLTVRMPNPPAIMHWTYPVPVRLAGSRNVYTIHDLVPLRLPQTSLEDRLYYDRLISTCMRQAAHIVTVSERSRADILDLFPTDPTRVTNTFQPADVPEAVPDPAALDRRIGNLFDLERDGYLLFFGAIEPKKNVGRLIEAYLGAELDTPLVIVGGRGWRSNQELRLLRGAHGGQLSAAARIRQIEYLPRPLLIDLVRGARAVLFPSLYEGFGLPALEALALGAPLVTSNTGSLPEVVGDAAITVDPYDVAALTAALRRIDGDAVLRKRLAALAPAQAELFSMARYQARLEETYRTILAAPK